MVGALTLLLVALSVKLWVDRDFWFPPDPAEAESTGVAASNPPAGIAPAQPIAGASKTIAAARPRHRIASETHTAVAVDQPAATPDSTNPPPVAIGPRTVLPPLEVEVVAGETHRTVRPGTNSVHVELQPDTPAQPKSNVAADPETAANVTSDAAEHVQMSVDTSQIVVEPARPDYPLLARQMKVQGSVILQALIGRDGTIQNLSVVSGPHILAAAAEDAVRQWHFKPHLENNEAVETQAKITVNFTISTN